MMKMMILAPRQPAMTHAQFRAYVTGVHGPLVRSITEVAADIRRYHYNFPERPIPALGLPVADTPDVVTEGWFDSLAAQRANMEHPRYLAIVRPDEGRFADTARAAMHTTHEIELQPGPATAHKLFIFHRRRPELSREAFQTLWRRTLTERLDQQPAWRGTIARHVQNHALAEAAHPPGMGARSYDVIDELFLHGPDPPTWTDAMQPAWTATAAELAAPGLGRCLRTIMVPGIACDPRHGLVMNADP